MNALLSYLNNEIKNHYEQNGEKVLTNKDLTDLIDRAFDNQEQDELKSELNSFDPNWD